MAQRLAIYKGMTEKEIKIFESVEELNRFAAAEFVRLSREAIKGSGRFTVALSGGSTPKKLYALLASDEFRAQIEWQKIFFFFGDERNVLPDSEDSNFRMANESLFSKIDIPEENIFRFLTERENPFEAADEMEARIRRLFDLKKGEFPRFDLILLGMGADGHTASLFPETTALNEKQRIVVANEVSKLDSYRLTLTFPAINSARRIIFLIAGQEKAAVLQKIMEDNTANFPASRINPTDGEALYLVDKKAASMLSQ